MFIPDFNYHKPASLKEAVEILEKNNDSVPVAGGTDLLVEIKQGLRYHNNIVSIAGLKELKSIVKDKNELYIGGGVTHNEIILSQEIMDCIPVLSEVASQIGTEQIRNTGTIGGNLCTGSSCCDTAPVLIALGASVEIMGSSGSRIVPISDFFIDHRKTQVKNGEILTRVMIRIPEPGTGVFYKKFGLREAAAISVASSAVMVRLENDICIDVSVVTGAVAPTPAICDKAADILKGKNIAEIRSNTEIIEAAVEAAAGDSSPIDDVRGSAEYRRSLVGVLVKRAILEALSRAEQS